MAAGVKIAQTILTAVKYDAVLINKIVHYISVHDNWLLGDDAPFQACKEMALFNDLDFLFVNSSYDNFKLTGESMGLGPKEFYDFWSHDEKLTRRPFCCQ